MFTNIKDVEAYQKSVISSAAEWVKGHSSIDNQEEIVIIADHYGIKLPSAFCNFQKSSDPFSASVCGASKTILKTLGKLAKKIVETEGADLIETKENPVYNAVLTILCGVGRA